MDTISWTQSLVLIVFKLLAVLQAGASAGGCDLNRHCVTLRECPLIIQQLRLAQSARKDTSFKAMNNILSAIRSTMCDVGRKTVCCPIYAGTVNLQYSSGVAPVYVLNETSVRVMDLPMAEQDTLESYFWKDQDCIPHAGFHLIDESFSFTYSPEKTFMDLNLPPSLSISALRCMAMWKNNDFLGYAHVKLPVTEIENNDVSE